VPATLPTPRTSPSRLRAGGWVLLAVLLLVEGLVVMVLGGWAFMLALGALGLSVGYWSAGVALVLLRACFRFSVAGEALK
jgi:predicted Co/Zn/Cd cation transporter (cation efflux family)